MQMALHFAKKFGKGPNGMELQFTMQPHYFNTIALVCEQLFTRNCLFSNSTLMKNFQDFYKVNFVAINCN